MYLKFFTLFHNETPSQNLTIIFCLCKSRDSNIKIVKVGTQLGLWKCRVIVLGLNLNAPHLNYWPVICLRFFGYRLRFFVCIPQMFRLPHIHVLYTVEYRIRWPICVYYIIWWITRQPVHTRTSNRMLQFAHNFFFLSWITVRPWHGLRK